MIPCSWVRDSIVTILEFTYTFNTVLIKIPPGSLVEIDKLIPKFYVAM